MPWKFSLVRTWFMSLVDVLLWSMEGVQESSTGCQEGAGTLRGRTRVERGAEIEEGRPRAKNLRHRPTAALYPWKVMWWKNTQPFQPFSRFHLLVCNLLMVRSALPVKPDRLFQTAGLDGGLWIFALISSWSCEAPPVWNLGRRFSWHWTSPARMLYAGPGWPICLQVLWPPCWPWIP